MSKLGVIEEPITVFGKLSNFLQQNPDWADVTIVIGDEKLSAHRLILASQSQVFANAFDINPIYPEKKQLCIIQKTSMAAFKMLIEYLYTGKVNLHKKNVENVAEFLELCHRYQINGIAKQIEAYLCVAVDAKSSVKILKVAQLLKIEILEELCWNLIEMTIEGIYEIELYLPFEVLDEVVARRERHVSEVKLFKTVVKMTNLENYCSKEEKQGLFDGIMYENMSATEFVQNVKPAKCLKPNKYLTLLEGMCHQDYQRLHPGMKFKKKITITGGTFLEFPEDETSEFIKLETPADGKNFILIEFESIISFNCIKFSASFNCKDGYIVKVSKDNEIWRKIVDYSGFRCIGDQCLFVLETKAKSIKIIGENLCDLKKLKPFEILFDPDPQKNFKGFVVPEKNVMSFDQSIELADGSICQLKGFKDKLEDKGIETFYEESRSNNHEFGYSLPQPYILSSLRFRLWDFDGRKYRYSVFVSDSNKLCVRLIYQQLELCDGWKTIQFSPRPVGIIWWKGKSNNTVNTFRIAYIETPASE